MRNLLALLAALALVSPAMALAQTKVTYPGIQTPPTYATSLGSTDIFVVRQGGIAKSVTPVILNTNMSKCVNPVLFGADPTGTNYSDTALSSAWATVSSASGCIQFPAGTFKFLTAATFSFPATAKYSFGLYGAGADATVFRFPTTAGFTFALASQSQSFHLANFSITTATTAAGNAITLTNSASFIGTFVAQSDITGVTCRGDDGYALSNYWTACVSENNVSDITFANDNFYGDSTGLHGNGIVLGTTGSGNCLTGSPYVCGTTYLVSESNFSFLGVGIQYGTHTQTLQVANSFFAQTNAGIYVPASSGSDLQGLAVTNSTFFTISYAIDTETSVPNLIWTNNFMDAGSSTYAMLLTKSNNSTIMGNQFVPRGSPSSTIGGLNIVANDSGSIITVDANTFSSVFATGAGINLGASTSAITVGTANAYTGSGTKINNSGTGNFVGAASCSGTPTSSFATSPAGMVTHC